MLDPATLMEQSVAGAFPSAAEVFPAPRFPDLIDNTMREAFVVCPTKFWYSFIRGVAPRLPSVHLHAGAAFARGLEVARKAFWEQGCPVTEAVGRGVVALLDFYGDFEPAVETNKTATRMAEALVSYFLQYPLDRDYLQPFKLANGRAAIEFTFAVEIPGVVHPVTGNPLLYGGRFDMLAVKNGVLFVDDEKTTQQLGPTWTKQWDLDSQFTGYCWAARTYGYPVAGAIVRGISILKEKFGHAESIQYRPEWMITRWLSQLQDDALRMIESWKAQKWALALGQGCKNYGGCPYLLLCTSPEPDRWIENHYTYRMWDPMHKGQGAS